MYENMRFKNCSPKNQHISTYIGILNIHPHKKLDLQYLTLNKSLHKDQPDYLKFRISTPNTFAPVGSALFESLATLPRVDIKVKKLIETQSDFIIERK